MACPSCWAVTFPENLCHGVQHILGAQFLLNEGLDKQLLYPGCQVSPSRRRVTSQAAQSLERQAAGL